MRVLKTRLYNNRGLLATVLIVALASCIVAPSHATGLHPKAQQPSPSQQQPLPQQQPPPQPKQTPAESPSTQDSIPFTLTTPLMFTEEFSNKIPRDLWLLLPNAASEPERVIEESLERLKSVQPLRAFETASYLHFVIARAYVALDQPTDALYHYNQVMLYLEDSGNKRALGASASYIGTVFFSMELYEKAKEQYQLAYDYFVEAGEEGNLPRIESDLALIEKELGEYDAAQRRYESLLTVREGAGKAFTYILLAELNLLSKQYPDSILIWLDQADELLERDITFEYGKFKGYVQEYRGDYYLAINPVTEVAIDPAAAREAYKQSLQWYKDHDFRLWLRASQKLASLEAREGNVTEAIQRMTHAVDQAGEQISFALWIELNGYLMELLEQNNQQADAYNIMVELTEKTVQYEEARLRTSLSLMDYGYEISQSRQTIDLQRAQIVRDRWITALGVFVLGLMALGGIVLNRRQRIITTQRLELEQQRAGLLESQVTASKWRNLRLQLKPHFLYNILSSLQGFIRFNPDKASQLIEHLAGYFQQILTAESKERVPLRQEISLCREYLHMQGIRYDGLIEPTFDVDPALEETLIPSMIIFPLVENAVKFGYKTADGESIRVHVDVKKEPCDGSSHMPKQSTDECLVISVCNTGHWVEPSHEVRDQGMAGNVPEQLVEKLDGNQGVQPAMQPAEQRANESDHYEGGLGLQNVHQRLQSHYQDQATLTHRTTDDVVEVSITLPLTTLPLASR
jgi:tetratricopeptide (TPR) repeat protein